MNNDRINGIAPVKNADGYEVTVMRGETILHNHVLTAFDSNAILQWFRFYIEQYKLDKEVRLDLYTDFKPFTCDQVCSVVFLNNEPFAIVDGVKPVWEKFSFEVLDELDFGL